MRRIIECMVGGNTPADLSALSDELVDRLNDAVRDGWRDVPPGPEIWYNQATQTITAKAIVEKDG